MAAEVHQNDFGTIFRITISDGDDSVDISSATTKQITFRKPDGTVVTQTAAWYTDGTDGILQYTTVDGDLDTVGFWKIQARIIMPTWNGRSAKGSFYCHSILV